MNSVWHHILRNIQIIALAIAVLSLGATPASAADDIRPVDAAIPKGLDFLASEQAADGSFGNAQRPAITGLALMAFLASGHTPRSEDHSDPNIGKFGDNVRNAIDYLLSQAQPDGSFTRNEKPMYGQGIATLALAEAYGVDPSESQRKRTAAVLAASVKLILTAQDVKKQDVYAGGWRYEPGSGDSDLSLSGWNVLALRACLDAGIPLPKGAVPRAVKFVVKCYNPEAKSFTYQPGGPPLASMNGVGILCLHVLDNSRPETEPAIKTLLAKPLDEASQFPYYGMYYATQAAFMASDEAGAAISKITFERLLKAQTSDGGWPDPPEANGAGRAYSTSMALLTLSIPYRLLPAYQR